MKAKPRKFSSKYFLIYKKTRIRVCNSLFLKVFSLKKKRLNHINAVVFNEQSIKETRGGDRKSGANLEQKENIIKFIGQLSAKESHYSRNKSKRVYLPSTLNIKKLWELYNNSVENDNLKVKLWLFQFVFNTKFNIGFSSPASDVCSLCTRLKHEIKVERDRAKRQPLITKLRIHTLRSKAFYNSMSSVTEECLSYCFDLQQVQPLPRTPI